MGGAIFVSAGQAAFSNQIISSLREHVPQVNPFSVIVIGATELRTVFRGPELAGVIDAFMDGIQVSFVVAIALAGLAVGAGFVVPWVSVKGKAEVGGGAG